MDLGRVSSAALVASGLMSVIQPQRVADALRIQAIEPRGLTEIRTGLGGTYVGLGSWALLTGTRGAHGAVGVTWLSAGVTRLASMKVDDPEKDAVFYVSLAMELLLGLASLDAARRT